MVEQSDKRPGAVVLLSGGQDSATVLFWAKLRFGKLLALSLNYGQRHVVELRAAAAVAEIAQVEHLVLEESVFASIGDSDLVRTGSTIQASGGHEDQGASDGLPSSFVPGRNLLFLAIAGAVAVKEKMKSIVTGVCQTDYSGYPDCRLEFVQATQRALTLAMPSSAGPLEIHTPLMDLTKAETVRLADQLGVDCWRALAVTVTCYEGQRPGCGICPSCALRRKGFEEAEFDDPAEQ